jgi:hypothetical protein
MQLVGSGAGLFLSAIKSAMTQVGRVSAELVQQIVASSQAAASQVTCYVIADCPVCGFFPLGEE